MNPTSANSNYLKMRQYYFSVCLVFDFSPNVLFFIPNWLYMLFIFGWRYFFRNFDFKNGYRNKLKDKSEKSCSWCRKRVSHKINLKVVWSYKVIRTASDLTLSRRIGLAPHAPVAQKIADQRWLIANSAKKIPFLYKMMWLKVS